MLQEWVSNRFLSFHLRTVSLHSVTICWIESHCIWEIASSVRSISTLIMCWLCRNCLKGKKKHIRINQWSDFHTLNWLETKHWVFLGITVNFSVICTVPLLLFWLRLYRKHSCLNPVPVGAPHLLFQSHGTWRDGLLLLWLFGGRSPSTSSLATSLL